MPGNGRRRGPLPAQRKRADAKKEQHGRTRKKSQKYLQLKSQEEDRRRKSATFKPPSSADFQNAADSKTKEFASYKAHRAGKLVMEVPPHHSSQECSACGHTHPDNRPSQAEFVCLRCGHTDNADSNASRVIKLRGVRMILAGEYRPKESKKTMRMAKKLCRTVGADRSERGSATSQKPAETSVRRPGSNAGAHGSGKQETPTYSQQG